MRAQLFTRELTMPFPVFKDAVGDLLKRPYYTDESTFVDVVKNLEAAKHDVVKTVPTKSEVLAIMSESKKAQPLQIEKEGNNQSNEKV